MSKDGTIKEFPWPSSRTANCQCRVSIQRGNVQIDTLHGDTGHVVKGVYFRPAELPEIIKALQEAQERIHE